MSRVSHLVLLGIGIALAIAVIWEAGPLQLWQTVVSLGPGLALILFFDGAGDISHAAGALYCFGAQQRRPPFVNMVFIRLAGRAYTFLTPTSGFGGDVLKGMLLRRYCSTHDAATVVIIDKFAFGVTQFGMAFIGSAAILTSLDIPARAKLAFWAISVVVWLGFAGFLLAQRRGWLNTVLRWVAPLLSAERHARIARHLAELDGRLQEYHRAQAGDLLRSVLWHALGFGTDIVATWLFLHFVLDDNSWMKATGIWALGTWFDAMAFAVPAGIGTQELSRALVFGAIGFSWHDGVAYALVLRIAQIFWSLAGLATHAQETGSARLAAAERSAGATTSPSGGEPAAAAQTPSGPASSQGPVTWPKVGTKPLP